LLPDAIASPKQQFYPVIFPTSALRLVLIDDSPDDRTAAIRALEQEFSHLQVQQATSADDLARVLRLGNFDLAIVSDRLTGMTGVASISAIKAVRPHCPVVVWTDSQSVEAAVAAMKAGADDYILKSSSQERLVAAVRELYTRKPPAVPASELKGEIPEEQAQLLDLAIDGIILRDLDGKISDWNRGAQRLYGWTPAEAIAKEIHALLKTEFPQAFEEIHQTLLAQDYWCGDLVQYRCDDTPIDVASCWTLQRDERGNPLAVLEINRDISDRKRRETTLQASEERFRRAIVHAPIPIAIHAENHGNGEMIQINNAWMELTGYAPADIPTIGDWTEKAYGEKKLLLQRSIDQLYDLDRRVDEGEYEVRTSSGERRIWRFSSAPLGKLPDGRRAVISMAADVTEHKQSERERENLLAQLERERELLEAVLQQMPAGVAIAEAPSGKLFMSNEQAARNLRHPLRLVSSIEDYSTYYRGFHPDGRPYASHEWPLARAIERGETIAAEEIDYLCGDGTRGVMRVSAAPVRDRTGRIIAGVVAFSDITERKQLETTLRQTILRLKNLHAMDKAILEVRSPQEIAQSAIDRLSQLLPLPRIDLIAFDADEQRATFLAIHSDRKVSIVPGAQIPLELLKDAIGQLPRGKSDRHWQLESLPELPSFVRAVDAEGLSSFLALPLNTQQETLGSLNLWGNSGDSLTAEQLAIAQEVADQLAVAIRQYRLQQQLVRHTSELKERVAERTLELQQSNAELEAFSYTVSHDLKAPLRAMQGFTSALLEDCGERLDELGHEYAQRIIKATQRLDRLIEDLLEYSRLGRAQLQLKPTSLESVVAEAIEQLEGEIQATGAQIQVGRKGIVPLPRIMGHRATLIQVLSNLLSNAIKFVPDRVRPRIEVWAEERSEDSDRVSVRLWIEDNGLGIKPEYQEQVWQVFERLHGRESYPGSGIGLAIVHKGMERMGGRAGVESSPNQGSRFWLEGQTVAKEQIEYG
jgi:PAS domain S-box-containing protein